MIVTYYDIKYTALLWSTVGHQRASIGCTVAPLHLTISDSFCAWTVILIRYELDQVLLQALKIHADCSLKFTAHQWSCLIIQIHTVLDGWDAAKTTQARVQQMTSRFHGSTIFVIRVHVVHGFLLWIILKRHPNDEDGERSLGGLIHLNTKARVFQDNGIIGRLAVCTITTLHVAHSEGQVSNLPRSFWHNW